MGVNSLPNKTVTRQRRGCDSNPGPTAPESSKLTTRLPVSFLPRAKDRATLLSSAPRCTGERPVRNGHPSPASRLMMRGTIRSAVYRSVVSIKDARGLNDPSSPHRRRKGSVVGGHHGECGARAYNEGLGAEPPAGSRGRAPGQIRGAKPPSFWSLDVQRSRQI